MRRVSPWFLLLVPVLGLSCAYGKNGLPPGDGDRGGGGEEASSEGEHEVDPGSPDPGVGSGAGSGEGGNPDGDGDPTTSGDNPDGDGDPTTSGSSGAGAGSGSGSSGAGAGNGSSGAGAGPAICGHDPCVPGAALDPGCDPCVAETCDADAFCCEMEWDQQCVDTATSCGCDPVGDPGGGTCAHDVCLPGVALDPGCDECAAAVCAADSFCCTDEWDVFCVLNAFQMCLACL